MLDDENEDALTELMVRCGLSRDSPLEMRALVLEATILAFAVKGSKADPDEVVRQYQRLVGNGDRPQDQTAKNTQ